MKPSHWFLVCYELLLMTYSYNILCVINVHISISIYKINVLSWRILETITHILSTRKIWSPIQARKKCLIFPCNLGKISLQQGRFPSSGDGFPYVFLYFSLQITNFPGKELPFCLFFPGLLSIPLPHIIMIMVLITIKIFKFNCFWVSKPY